MDKAEIREILELLRCDIINCIDDIELAPVEVLPRQREMISDATSSLTALIIKWLEGKNRGMEEVIKQKDIEFRTINDESGTFKIPIELSKEYLEYISQAVITELVEEMK